MSRTERTKWRVTFRNLASQAQSALHAQDTAPAEQAMEQLIDLACEMRNVQYFHSEDPVEAAKFVVSDAASALWQTVLDRYGFIAFAGRATPQLIRWESGSGWTEGNGKVAERETTLAAALAPLLASPEMWRGFAAAYLSALDAVARAEAAAAGKGSGRGRLSSSGGWSDADYRRSNQARTLAAWHAMLAEHLADPDDADLLGRLASHPVLDAAFLRAQIR